MNDKKSSSSEDVVSIKKYANRRLYNMQTSSYVTLEDLADLVKQNVPFIVRDAKTDADLTRQVLVQIILEQEMAGAEMIPIDLLRSMIRYYNTDMHQSLSGFLSSSMRAFNKNQSEFLKSFTTFSDWEAIQEKQNELFKKTFEMMNPLKPKV